MNKNHPLIQLWQVLYPLLLYYAVVLIVLSFARIVIGSDDAHYVICQLIATVFAIPVMLPFYRVDRAMLGNPPLILGKKEIQAIAWAVLLAGLLSISCNNMILMSPLVDFSEGFKEANAGFYGSTLWLELVSSALLTPVLEELVFRGIVYGRIRRMIPVVPAVIVSALLFALVHFNVVQFVYAFVMGIFLAVLVELCGHMYVAVAGHMMANAIAVIRTETGFLSFTADSSVRAWSISFVLFGLFVLLMALFLYRERKHTNE